MEIKSSRIKIGGKIYVVTVIDGKRYVNGKTITEFMDTLSLTDIKRCAVFGRNYLMGKKTKRKKFSV